jgi:hypothetical protein
LRRTGPDSDDDGELHEANLFGDHDDVLRNHVLTLLLPFVLCRRTCVALAWTVTMMGSWMRRTSLAMMMMAMTQQPTATMKMQAQQQQVAAAGAG